MATEAPPAPVENAPAQARPQTLPAPSREHKPLTPWNVVLLNDDDHTYEYVVAMLRSVFGFTDERAYQIAKEVDEQGRAICLTTHKELAELKRDQLSSFGRDPLIMSCKGSMSAVIEPAIA